MVRKIAALVKLNKIQEGSSLIYIYIYKYVGSGNSNANSNCSLQGQGIQMRIYYEFFYLVNDHGCLILDPWPLILDVRSIVHGASLVA